MRVLTEFLTSNECRLAPIVVKGDFTRTALHYVAGVAVGAG